MRRRVCLILPGSPRREQLWHDGSEKVASDLKVQWFLTPPPGDVPMDHWQEIIGDVDAIITCWDAPRFTENILPQTDRLKVIAHAAGSVEPIMSPAIFKRGIKLLSCNRYMADAVAEYAMMMTMVGLRRLHVNAQFGTDPRTFTSFIGGNCTGLDQASIGIWGLGDVTRHLIGKLKALGVMHIAVHNDYLSEEQAAKLGVEKIGFDQMFATCDVVHLCEALREDTLQKVRAPQLAAMKPNAVLINTGRAMLVHEQDMLTELKKQRIIGIFDVHYTEPLPEDSPFRQLPNVIITPHLAGSTGRGRYTSIMLQEIVNMLDGKDSEYEISEERAARMTRNQLVKGKR